MATIDATYLIGALLGPGGLSLIYLSMAYSKNYQEMHAEYHHHAFKWEELTQLAIATNRE
jgi:putative Mn2+ efflux pump MntP